MVHFEINGKNYTSFERWDEMTIAKGIELSTLCLKAPAKLLDYYSIIAGIGTIEKKEEHLAKWSEAVGDVELIKEFPEFYGRVMVCLSDIPEELMKFASQSTRVVYYKKFFESFVIGILHNPIDYKHRNILDFIFKGKRYCLPVTRNILGNDKPMADATAIEFTESADLQIASKNLEAGQFEYSANIIAILCRPMMAGILEPYDEKVSLERAEKFKALKMDIVWEVFFCLQKQINLFNLNMVNYFLMKTVAERKASQADLKSMAGTPKSYLQPEALIK